MVAEMPAFQSAFGCEDSFATYTLLRIWAFTRMRFLSLLSTPKKARRAAGFFKRQCVHAQMRNSLCAVVRIYVDAIMRTILMHTPKGGSGKSTLSREMAAASVLRGQRTALIDLDPQGTITGWYGRREGEQPVLVAPEALTGDNLEPIRASGIEFLVIDTPPGAPSFMPRLFEQADVVLVPVRPSPDDLLAAAPIAANLASHPRWAFVLTQATPRSRLAYGAVRQLAAIGRVAPVTIGFRADFPAAAIEGKAAVEFKGTKAADEVTELRMYVDTLIGIKNGKAKG